MARGSAMANHKTIEFFHGVNRLVRDCCPTSVMLPDCTRHYPKTLNPTP
jgi:hypothetical protein